MLCWVLIPDLWREVWSFPTVRRALCNTKWPLCVCLRIGEEWRKQCRNSAIELTEHRAESSGPVNGGYMCFCILSLHIRLEGVGEDSSQEVSTSWINPLTYQEHGNSNFCRFFPECVGVIESEWVIFLIKGKKIPKTKQAHLLPLISVPILAWGTRKQHRSNPQRVHNPLLLHCPSPILSLPACNTRLPQQRGGVGAIFTLTPFCIIKKKGGKDLPWSTLPPVWQIGCLGHPCDPETQRESKGESRYPTPHPLLHCGAERPAEASDPPQLLLLLPLAAVHAH